MAELAFRKDLNPLLMTTLLFFAWRVVQYLLVILTPKNQFDSSTELTIYYILSSSSLLASSNVNSFWNARLWNKLLSWDAVFFIKRMALGNCEPDYEHEHAFTSLWVYTVRLFSKDKKDLYTILKIGVLLENILFYLSTVLLYFLTVSVFSHNNPRSEYARKVARNTVKIFVFSSVSGYLTGIYSEPLSFALAFLGMLAREKSIHILIPFHVDCRWSRWPLYLFSAVCFSLATVNRANCILLGFYYIFDLIQLTKIRRYSKAFLFPLLSGILMSTVCCYQIYYLPYKTFCPDRAEWCNTQILKSLPFTKTMFYNYIQSHYWNVGFLKYWTWNNLPNFIIAFPNVVVLLYSTVYFSKIYPYFTMRPLIWITRALVLIIVLFAHVQIINRVSSFIPLHLWYISDRLTKGYMMKDHKGIMGGDDKIVKGYLYWLIFWVPLQTILFASFLPPA